MQTKNECINKIIVHQCSYCAKSFKYESDRRRHENSHNPQFCCGVCQKKFSFLSALNRHKKQHDRSARVECEKCGKTFKDDILLQRHCDYAHKGTHSCKQCKSVFQSSLALKNHMKVHKSEDRKYVCGHAGCGKNFYSIQHLRHHELNHTNTKQFYCNDCGKGFIQRNHLTSHAMMHRPEDWLPCLFEGCKKAFPTEYARKRHLDTHKKKKSSCSKVELSVRKEYIKESKRGIKHSKKTKRQLNRVLKENDVSSNNSAIIAKGDSSNQNSEKRYKDKLEKYIYEMPIEDFVIEIIKADNDARKEKTYSMNAITNYTKLSDNTQVISLNDIDTVNTIGNPVHILNVKEFVEEEESCAVKSDSAMNELTPTQDAVHELTSTQDAIDELTATQEAIDELTATHNSIKEFTTTQYAMGEFLLKPDSEAEHTSTHNALDEFTSTQDALDDFISTQDAIDEFTSKPLDGTDESPSNKDMVDDFRCGNCDCTSIKLKDLDFINNINDKIELPLCKKVMPNLEHREDGAIKLTDTFEFDSFPDDDDVDNDVNSNHTCKTLFGNCIVSGSSKVSDKCICAKISKCENVDEVEYYAIS